MSEQLGLSDLEFLRTQARHAAKDARDLKRYPMLGQMIYDELQFRAGLNFGLDAGRMRRLLGEVRSLLVLLHTTEPDAA